ncbi:MAG TPA: decarboxylating 6-phosphogluconate dehydrogenase [Polyangiales bacterium]|nr:decarboxylating 6-phosphogluconate dehydrogenase [Polyangiales bacterium]
MSIVVMGVSGAGKSTVGRALAERYGRTFLDGDDLHPEANVRKMAAGEPLTEADRAPWLTRIAESITRERLAGRTLVLACSALSRASRRALRAADPNLVFVHLAAPRAVIEARLRARSGHFMPASLLDSQLAALEEPAVAITVDASEPVAVIVERIAVSLRARNEAPPRSAGAVPLTEERMQIGMIGLGRMGANMVRRLRRAGHDCVVYDASAERVAELAAEGATGVAALEELVARLPRPRVACVMVPAALVDGVLDQLAPQLDSGDVVIDGGNSHFHDDVLRASRLAERGVHYVDMGTSGGVRGLERGYCLMIGGEKAVVERLDPVFAALAPGADAAAPTLGRANRASTAERGYLHCGPAGAGHFVKMVHNGIEYGLMAAYAEGLNILNAANAGREPTAHDAETAPIRNAEQYHYAFDLADITELWRRGSVISSWLLDLTAQAFAEDPALDHFEGKVSDSGEGRWTIAAANDLGVPAHVLVAALFERFASRGQDAFQNKVLSAMRLGFGGHRERG